MIRLLLFRLAFLLAQVIAVAPPAFRGCERVEGTAFTADLLVKQVILRDLSGCNVRNGHDGSLVSWNVRLSRSKFDWLDGQLLDERVGRFWLAYVRVEHFFGPDL